MLADFFLKLLGIGAVKIEVELLDAVLPPLFLVLLCNFPTRLHQAAFSVV